MKITVTKDDIVDGCQRSLKGCPIALALIRAHVNFHFVDKDAVIRVDATPIPLPECVRQFIRSFDAGHPVKPFTFTIPD